MSKSGSQGRQIGAVIVKNGQVIGFEMAGHPDSWKALQGTIYQKYAIDIAAVGEKVDINPQTMIEQLILELRDGKVEKGQTNIGGQNIFIETPQLRGSFFQRGQDPLYVSVVRK